jgi:hypothetical protein
VAPWRPGCGDEDAEPMDGPRPPRSGGPAPGGGYRLREGSSTRRWTGEDQPCARLRRSGGWRPPTRSCTSRGAAPADEPLQPGTEALGRIDAFEAAGGVQAAATRTAEGSHLLGAKGVQAILSRAAEEKTYQLEDRLPRQCADQLSYVLSVNRPTDGVLIGGPSSRSIPRRCWSRRPAGDRLWNRRRQRGLGLPRHLPIRRACTCRCLGRDRRDGEPAWGDLREGERPSAMACPAVDAHHGASAPGREQRSTCRGLSWSVARGIDGHGPTPGSARPSRSRRQRAGRLLLGH